MFIKTEDKIIEIFNENILFIDLINKDDNLEDTQVKVYLRDGQTIEGFITRYSLTNHPQLILNKNQWIGLKNVFDDKLKRNKYKRRLDSIFRVLNKLYIA